jgi:ankyrin repeat protein
MSNYISKYNLYSAYTSGGIIENKKVIVGAYIRIYEYKKEKYIENIKKLLNNENYEVLNEDYYETKINLYNSYYGSYYSNIYLCDKWDLQINPDKSGNILPKLISKDVRNNHNTHIIAKCIFVIRNCNTYSNYSIESDKDIKFVCFDKDNDTFTMDEYINKNNLKSTYPSRSVIENDSAIIGVYVRIFKYTKEKYIENLKKLIDNEGKSVLKEDYYEWKIDNFDNYSIMKNECSSEFNICNHKWKLILNKNGNGRISIELKSVDAENSKCTHINAKFALAIRNYYDYSYFYTGSEDDIKLVCFDNENISYSINNYITLRNPYNFFSNKPLTEDGKTIIGVYIRTYDYNKAQFEEEIKSKLSKYNMIDEGFYEWKISNWKFIKDKSTEYSPEFTINNKKWKIKVYPNGNDESNKNYISIFLESVDAQNNDTTHILGSFVFYIRNYNNYSDYYYSSSNIDHFNENSTSWGWNKFIQKSSFLNSNNKLIYDNKTIIGVYICTYKYEKEHYNKDLKDIIKVNTNKFINDGYYEWNIDNWNSFISGSYSPEFNVGGHKWKIQLYPNGDNINGYTSVYLKSIDVKRNILKHIYIKFTLFIRNYMDYSTFYSDGVHNCSFSNYNDSYKSSFFIEKNKLFSKNSASNRCLVENNKANVGAYIQIYKYDQEQYINGIKSLIHDDNHLVISKDYYEYEIENWKENSNKYIIHQFTNKNKNHSWEIHLDARDTNYVTVNLKSLTIDNDPNYHINAKSVIVICNSDDNSYYYTNGETTLNYYNKYNNLHSWKSFIKKEDLYRKNEELDKSLVENDKLKIGTCICEYKYDKEQFDEELKQYINDDGCKNIRDGYYEWPIESWKNNKNEEYNNEFILCDHKWNINLTSNMIKNNEYLSFTLKNKDIENDEFIHLKAKCILVIRNYQDYSCFYSKGESKFNYYNKYNNLYHWKNFITTENLNKKNISNKSINENNKFIVGIYLRIYEYTENQYMEEIRNYVKDNNKEPVNESYYEWNIKDWDRALIEDLHHEFSDSNTYNWKINICSNNNNENYNDKEYISTLLENKSVKEDPYNHIYAKYLLTIRNYKDSSYFFNSNEFEIDYYNKYNNSYKWDHLIKKNDLVNINEKFNKSLIEDNKTVLGIYVRFYKYNREQLIEELGKLVETNDNETLLSSNYYEWEFKNSKDLSNKMLEKEFENNKNQWLIQFKRNIDKEDYLSVTLKNVDVEVNKNTHICTKILIILRNTNDYSCFYSNKDTKYYYYSHNIPFYRWKRYIHNTNSSIKSECSDKLLSLIENNDLVVGVYINTYKQEKEHYIEEIKSLVYDNSREILTDGYYEWQINDWNSLQNDEFSEEFEIGDMQWKLLLNPNGFDDKVEKGDISVYLKNLNAENSIGTHLYAKCLLSIRNTKDYSNFYTNGETKFKYYNQHNNTCQWKQFIEKSALSEKNIITNDSIIENDQAVIGTYIRIYKYGKEQYLEEISSSINNDNHEVLCDGYYEWNIEEWDNLQEEEFSDEFKIHDTKWKMCLYSSNEDKNGFVSLYLKNEDVENGLSEHVYAKCLLTIRNINDYSCFHSNGESNFNYYNKCNNSNGWKNFIKRKNLFSLNKQSNKSIIENGKAVIGAYIRIFKYEEEQYYEELQTLINDDKNEIISQGYREWKINQWNEILDDEFIKEFEIGDHQWKLTLNPNGFDDKADNDYISVNLKDMNPYTENNLNHFYVRYLITLRNKNDYSCFYTKNESELNYFNKNNISCEMKQFINKKDLFRNNKITNCTLLENNEIVVGVKLCLYNYKKDQYFNENNTLFKDNTFKMNKDNYYEWKIENIDSMNSFKECSPEFEMDGYKWELQLYPNGNSNTNNNNISIYLKNKSVENNISAHIKAKCLISLHNYDYYSNYYTNNEICTYEYNQYNSSNGWDRFIKKEDLYNTSIIKNGKFIISVNIRSYKYNKEQFIKEIKDLAINKEGNQNQIKDEKYFEWKIENWNRFSNGEIFSSEFEDNENKWAIKISSMDKNNDEDLILINLINSNGESINSNFNLNNDNIVLFISNYKDYSTYIANQICSNINSNSELHVKKEYLFSNNKTNFGSSLIEDGKTIIGAYICYREKPVSLKESFYSSSLDYYNNNKWKEVHVACKNGNIKQLNHLISSGINLSEKTKDEWFPLHIACQFGHLDIVQLLIENGVNINITMNGKSAIELACQNNYNDIVELLLERGADINLGTQNEYKLLHIATKNNNLKMVKLLLKKGHLPVDAKNSKEWTALHIASRYNYYQIGRYLIKEGHSYVNEINQEQNTSLHISSQYGNTTMAQLLISNNADVNYKNEEGWTPLHVACKYGYEKIVQLLLENYANINMTTYKYMTPLHIAVYYNQISVIKYLLQNNNSIDSEKVNNEGKTVFDLAKEKNNKEINELLEKYANSEKENANEKIKLYNSIRSQDIINLLNEQFNFKMKN